MTETYLDKAYTPRDAESTRQLYDDWAATYDEEVGAQGYATPRRCAEALAAHVDDPSVPLLDFGCGTGLSGLAFKMAGFQTIDGMDLSPDMLAQARAKNVYRTLTQIDSDTPIPTSYELIAAVGSIGAGAAPISVFDQIMHALPQGGKLVFSLNDHALAEPENMMRLNEWLDCGAARLLFSEYGPHLPGLDMNSHVYVIEKA